MLLLIYAERKA